MPPDGQWGNSRLQPLEAKAFTIISILYFYLNMAIKPLLTGYSFCDAARKFVWQKENPQKKQKARSHRDYTGLPTQKSNKGNRFRWLIWKCCRRLPCIIEWKFTKSSRQMHTLPPLVQVTLPCINRLISATTTPQRRISRKQPVALLSLCKLKLFRHLTKAIFQQL